MGSIVGRRLSCVDFSELEHGNRMPAGDIPESEAGDTPQVYTANV